MELKIKILIVLLAVLLTALAIIVPAFATDRTWVFQVVADYDVYPQAGEHWDCQVTNVAFDASEPGWATLLFCRRQESSSLYLPIMAAK